MQDVKTIKFIDPMTFEEKEGQFFQEHLEIADKILTAIKNIDGFDPTQKVISDEKNLYVGLKPARNIGDPEGKYFYRIIIERKERQ